MEGFTAEEVDEPAHHRTHQSCYCDKGWQKQARAQQPVYQDAEEEGTYEVIADDGDLDEDEYIEEEHQYTLNELYAQAH